MSTPFASSAGLTAAGTNQATALALGLANFAQVSVAAAGTGVLLPVAPPGFQCVVRNDGVAPLSVYPNLAGNINGGTNNVALLVNPAEATTFVSSNGVAWFTFSTFPRTQPVVNVTAAATLLPSQSGSLVTVSSATAYTVTLPAVAAGLKYRIVKLNATANAVQVTALTAVMQGCIAFADVGTGANGTLVAAKTNLVFIATGLAGDFIDLQCDGVNWYVEAMSGTTLGITTS